MVYPAEREQPPKKECARTELPGTGPRSAAEMHCPKGKQGERLVRLAGSLAVERVTEERKGLRGIGSANEERKGERHRNRVGKDRGRMMQTRNPEKGEKKGMERKK